MAESIEEVNKELVFNDTVFITKDFTNMWLKTVKGEVKKYMLTEIVDKDEKDLMIENLQKQIDELKGRLGYEEYVDADNVRTVEDSKPTRFQDGPTNDGE